MTGPAMLGLMAEFATPEAALAAARRLQLNGFRHVDAYTPFPVEELGEVLRPGGSSWIPTIISFGTIIGAVAGYFLEYYAEVVNYPINVGGRPYNSWPAFGPIALEIAMLFGIASAFFSFLLFCRLPRLYHPVFDAPDFDRASQDRFFLCVRATDPWYDRERVRWIFERYGADRVSEVPS